MSVTVIKIIEEAPPAASGGAGCGCLIGLFLVGGMLYEFYKWFMSILPTLMFIGGCVVAVVVFISLVKALGIGPTLVIALLAGSGYGIYSYFVGAAEEAEQEAYQKQAELERAEAEKEAAKVAVAETARMGKINNALGAYFSPPGTKSKPPALFVNVHDAYDPDRPRRRKSASQLTITSTRIEGLTDTVITAVKYFKQEGFYTFTGQMEKYSGPHKCFGSVEYNKRGRDLILGAFCLKEGSEDVESSIRYVPIKTKKTRRGLEQVFATDVSKPKWEGLYTASTDPCSKKKRVKTYAYVGRSMVASNAPASDIKLFMVQSTDDGLTAQLTGMSHRYQRRVDCQGAIEPVGAMKQARVQCSSSFVDPSAPATDGSYSVSTTTHSEQVLYLCSPLKRFR